VTVSGTGTETVAVTEIETEDRIIEVIGVTEIIHHWIKMEIWTWMI
jgi:hypothetical protein